MNLLHGMFIGTGQENELFYLFTDGLREFMTRAGYLL